MAASITVDIKAQITGYQEQIEKIKAEMKKIDPGSSIGKGLVKSLSEAEKKLNSLTRDAEKRITSQGQLDSLFDRLHQVHDLVQTMGQGLSNVGLNDVLITASEQARALGQELQQVKTEMNQKGASFFDELKKTNPKELQAVFDQLKFDPKTMGIEEFVSRFKQATAEAGRSIDELKKKQTEAQAKADAARVAADIRKDLPPEFQQTTKYYKTKVGEKLGSTQLTQAAQKTAQENIQQFLNQVRTELDKDQRSDKNNDALDVAINQVSNSLLNAKSESAIQDALLKLNEAIIKNTQNDSANKNKSLESLTGGINIDAWVDKLTTKTTVDQNFITKVEAIADALSKNTLTSDAGHSIREALQKLLDPNDIRTVEEKMQQVVQIVTDGLNKIQDISKQDPVKAQSIANTIAADLKQVQEDAKALNVVKNSPLYAEFEQKVTSLENRLLVIEERLGIEKEKASSGVAEGVRTAGQNILNNTPKLANEATQSLKQYGSMLENVQARQQMVGRIEGIAQRWFSVYAAVRMVTKAFNSMKQNVQNLDKTITEIAIVTDMSQSDLWKQMPQYTELARKYGASLEGVYEVSQLYYQQGLEQSDVMALTEQTLKMARISGLDYGEATNYMTNAIRSFKIEMQDAQRVVDVYSALAATSASSTSELATAMSKTASSAAAVGSSFEATSAMMAVMIETTRESPENIGSALKSIISRYGELKENKTGIDEEGEEYSLNKVDTALQSVGISIHDAKGEFRDFDEVIMELADSWDTIDTNTQRYIATVMAGNRQQSRFLALVSNGKRLREETEVAENSEDAASLQMLKTMDSIDYKSQQLQTSLQSLYTSSGVENLYKGILDGANAIVTTFTNMPTIFSAPIPALISLGTTFLSVANVVMTGLAALKQRFVLQSKALRSEELADAEMAGQQMTANAQAQNQKQEEDLRASEQRKIAIRQTGGTGASTQSWVQRHASTLSKVALAGNIVGTGLTMISSGISDRGNDNRAWKGVLGTLGSTIQDASLGFQLAGPWGALAGSILGLGQGIFTNMQYWIQSTADQAKRLQKEAEEDATAALQKRAEVKNLETQVKSWKELKKLRTDSAEAEEKFLAASNQLAAEAPELISYYDSEGNAVLSLANAYDILIQKREEANKSALDAAISAEQAAHKTTESKQEVVRDTYSAAMDENITINDTLAKELQDAGYSFLNAPAISVTGLADFISFDSFNPKRQQWASGQTSLAYLIRLLNRDNINNEDVNGLNTVFSALMEGGPEYIQKLRDQAKFSGDSVIQAFTDLLIKQFQTVQTAIGDEQKAEASQASVERSQIANLIQGRNASNTLAALYNNDVEAQRIMKVLDEFDAANGLAVDYVVEQWKNLSQGLSGEAYDTAFKDFVTNLSNGTDDSLTTVLNILSQVNSDFYDDLNELYDSRDLLTLTEYTTRLQKIFEQSEIDTSTQNVKDVITAATQYYTQQKLIWDEVFGKDGKGAEWQYKFTEGFAEQALGIEEQRSIINHLSQINRFAEEGTVSTGAAEKFTRDLQLAWGKTMFTDDPQKDLLQAYLTNFELTNDSIQEVLANIEKDTTLSPENKTWLTSIFSDFFELLPSNLITTLNSYIDNFSKSSDDYTKWLQKSTEGMSLKEASELASLLQISPTDERFQREGSKILFKDTALIYDKYFGDNGIFSAMGEEVQTQKTTLEENLGEIASYDFKNTTKEFHGISAKDMYAIDQLRQDAGMEWNQEFLDYFANLPEQYRAFGADYIKSIQLDQAIDKGKIEDAIKSSIVGVNTPGEELIKELTTSLSTALKSGDFTSIRGDESLSQEFKDKLPEMKVAYDEAENSLLSSLVDGLTEGYQVLEITDYNRDLFTDIQSNYQGLFKDIVTNSEGKVISASLDTTLTNLDTIYEIIENYATPEGSAAERQKREWLSNLKQQKYDNSKEGLLSAIMESYDSVSMTTFEAFKDAWGEDSGVKAIFKQQADGTYKANLPLLTQFMRDNYQDLDELTRQSIEETLTKTIDDGMSSITNAADYVIKGTTRYQDMADFVKQFNEISESADIGIADVFTYNQDLRSYTLDTKAYQTYLQNEAQVLAALGQDTTYINGLLNNTTKTLAEAIDIQGFLDAEDKSAGSEAYRKLETSLTNYITSNDELFNRLKDSYIAENLAGAPEDIQRAVKEGLSGRSIADFYISQIKQGGMKAVSVMKAVAQAQGVELKASDIEAAYLTEINDLESALDQLDYGVGSLVSGRAVNVLRQAGYTLQDLGGGTAVISSIGEISEAYQAYYDALKNSNEATLAALNEAKAKVLETKFGRAEEQIAIDALGDATGMTYSTFAEIFTNVGMELTDDMMEQMTEAKVIESMGGNKLRIKDFNRFAQAMHWDYNSEEYISAFKSYNDGLIELNKKTETNITEELKGLEEAKPGDWINFTNIARLLNNTIYSSITRNFVDEFGKEQTIDITKTAFTELNDRLHTYGASLEAGILKLGDNANLLGIAESIKDVAKNTELDLTDGFKELSDIVQNILKSYVDAIQKGITGGLTHVEAADLKLKAQDLGVFDIDFKTTADGLQLSEQAAISLYNALKRIDGLQASLVFDGLREALEATNENFESVSSLTSYIVETRRALNDADSNVSDARLQQYQAELSVAQEILAVRSTQEDDSFNFMSKDIPAAQKNPLNYAKNWTEALHKIRDAWDTTKITKGSVDGKGGVAGFIDYEDYYNIVTELNNVAGISGQLITIGHDIEGNALSLDGSLEAASAAIQAGCDSLTTVDTGDLKVNLGAIGLNIESGAADMQNSVTQGIQAAAHAQVEMLDGLIAMLELIVAMEKLGDITGEDTTIDLGDIFTVSGQAATEENLKDIDGYTKKFNKARTDLINYLGTNKEAEQMFKNAKLGLGGQQFSLYQLLADDFSKTFGTMKPEDRERAAKSFQGILDSFYQAAISGDYDLNNIAASVKDIMQRTGVELENFVFEFTDDNGKVTRILTFMGETVIDIDFSNEDTRKNFDKYFNTQYAKDEEGYRQYIQDELKTYQTKKEAGTLTRDELIKIRTELGVASNEFVLRQDKDGRYVGYYEGKKFQGTNSSELIQAMGQAAIFKDKGYDFTVKEDEITGDFIKLVAKTVIGGTEVEVDFDDKVKPVYSYGGYSNLSEDEIKGLLAKEGRYDTGGTFEFTDENGKKYTSTVQYSQDLDLSYSWVVDDSGEKHLMYNGHDFGENWDALQSFDQFRDKMDPQQNGQWKGEKYITTLNVGGDLRITSTYDVQQDQITMQIGNDTFTANTEKAPEMFAQYLELAQKDNFKDVTKHSTGYLREIEYNYGKMLIHGTIGLASGDTNYTYTDGEGNVMSSASPEALEYVLGRFAATDVENAFSKETVSYNIKGFDVELVVDTNGNIKLAEGSAINANLTEEARKQVQEKLDSVNQQPVTLENPVEAKADKIQIVTEGATPELDVETLEVKDVDVKVKAKSLEVDASGATPGAITVEQDSSGGNGTSSNNGGGSTTAGEAGGATVPVTPVVNPTDVSDQLTPATVQVKPQVQQGGGQIVQAVQTTQTVTATLADMASGGLSAVAKAAEQLNAQKAEVKTSAPGAEDAADQLGTVSDKAKSIPPSVSTTVNALVTEAKNRLQEIIDKLSKITSKDVTVTTTYKEVGKPSGGGNNTTAINATGNFGLAHAKSTLMGELGPELVVSNNRYFVAGQSGPEFVDLDNDAIVFNHLQTQQLLKNGMSPTRGQAVTNERNAVAFAKGSLAGGPAMASAAAALAALKQLRSQWAALEKLSVQDLAGKGGSGGGGGGGGGGGDPKAFVKDLERWYNWLQKIARLEKEINYQEALRSKLTSDYLPAGKEYFKSQMRSLVALKEEAVTNEDLYKSQQNYFNKRRQELNTSGVFRALYSFDEYGQLQYKDGQLEKLSNLVGRNAQGKPNYTAAEQYDMIVKMGYGDQMIYDTSGNEIDRSQEGWETTAVQTFWDKMDAERDEMQSLYDSVEEHKTNMLENYANINELLHEMEDNQISLENQVLDAIVEMREREIDAIEDEKNAIREAADHMIDGLSEQLEKEREMYQRQQDTNELGKLQRQLSILQRSGGSGAQIAQLRSQINDKTQQIYFDTQQQQIDELQEAVDTQIERLEEQIDLMKEQLEYEKDHGLLWREVNEIMKGTAPEITNFIMQNTAKYWGENAAEYAKNQRQIIFESEQYKAFAEQVTGGLSQLVAQFCTPTVTEDLPPMEEIEKAIEHTGIEEDTEAANKNAQDEARKRAAQEHSNNVPSGPSAEYIANQRKNAEKNSTTVYEVTVPRSDGTKSTTTFATKTEADRFASAAKSGIGMEWANRAQLNPSLSMEDANAEAAKATANIKPVEKKVTIQTKEFGGMVNQTGIELLHAKEAVLTAEQAKMFREDLLGHSRKSVVNQLKAVADFWQQLDTEQQQATTSTFSQLYGSSENGLTYRGNTSGYNVWIENAAVNMQVARIADDYDAQRAGEQALEKMLQIARKTSGWNRIGG